MQVIERWSGWATWKRHWPAKANRVNGHGHKRCITAHYGGGCCCGLAGKKWYRIPLVYQLSVFDIFTPDHEWWQRKLSTARKWGRKRAWQMFEKYENRIGRMEYIRP